MNPFLHILADTDEIPIKAIVFVIAMIVWGISALAKAGKKVAEEQRQRLRQVRDSIQQSQQTPARPIQAAPRPPVQLAPQIQMRIPPPTAQRPAQKRRPMPAARPAQAPVRRPAANYNAMAAKQRRPAQAPPPLPAAQTAAVFAQEQVIAESPVTAPPVMSTSRKPVGVGAQAIRRWLRPATLRQQFILTELFQPPLALRQERL